MLTKNKKIFILITLIFLLLFNTKVNAKLSAEIDGSEEVLYMESSKVNTTNYISSNMAEEENKRLRELLLDDFCAILLKNA